MNRAKATPKRDLMTGNAVRWASQHRPGLILAGMFVPLVGVLALVPTPRGKGIALLVLVSVFLVLACAVLAIAVAQIGEQLKAIRGELVMIRTQVNTTQLDDIATDLTAMRAQMDKGVLGLLGM